jgi:phytoene dehydrogenase-like protein
MASFVRACFADERVQGAFVGGGGDPRKPGSMLEAAWGSASFDPEWAGLPEGGMGALADALAAAATAAGATIRTGVGVARVLVEDGAAVGVETEEGEAVRARIVVSNLGPKPTFLDLVEPGALDAEFRARVDGLSMTVAWVKAHFALRGPLRLDGYLGPGHDPLAAAYVRMCPSIEVMTRSWDDAAAGRPAAEPVIQLGSLSVHDPGSAPDGCHAVSALTFYAPPRPAEASWDDLRDGVAEALIDQIDGYLPGFRRSLAGHVVLTPLDLERRYAMVDGNIDHADHLPGQFFTGRPFEGSGGWRTPLRGLYCCGSGTHPGGEVSGAPGYNAARAILADEHAARRTAMRG